MFKFNLFSLFLLFSHFTFSATYNISISGTSYTPATTTCKIGDTINIQASANHPAIQVSKSDWDNGINTPSGSGWGTKTSLFQLVIANNDSIFFMCANHGPSGMKAMIVVENTSHIPNEKIESQLPNFCNPVMNGQLRILSTVENKDVLMIYNNIGSKVAEKQLVSGQENVLISIPSGTYWVQIKKANGLITGMPLLFN